MTCCWLCLQGELIYLNSHVQDEFVVDCGHRHGHKDPHNKTSESDNNSGSNWPGKPGSINLQLSSHSYPVVTTLNPKKLV